MLGAGKILRKQPLFFAVDLAVVQGDDDKSAGRLAGVFHRIGKPGADIALHDKAIHHHVNVVAQILVQIEVVGQIIDAAVDAHTNIAAL